MAGGWNWARNPFSYMRSSSVGVIGNEEWDVIRMVRFVNRPIDNQRGVGANNVRGK